jgi:hypothetical protein
MIGAGLGDRQQRVSLPIGHRLPVALRKVRIADREQRAGHLYRQMERGAGDERLDVEIAAGLLRREGAQCFAGDARRGRHRADRVRRPHPVASGPQLGLARHDLLQEFVRGCHAPKTLTGH